LDLATITHVRDIVVGDLGHPDQFPYIDFWYIQATRPPDWLHFHSPQRHTAILVNDKVKEKKFEVHHTSEPELPDPPPYVPLVHPTTPASPRSESDSEDPNGKEEALEPNPHTYHPRAPSLCPSLPSMVLEKDMSHWGRSLNSGRLTSKEARTPGVALCPLCQAPGPPLPQADRSYVAGPMQYMYQPFTTTDLLNWQQHTPAYSEEPQSIIELLTSIMHSYQLNWDDCRQLMSNLLTSDECQ
jgi:hypothetical protein